VITISSIYNVLSWHCHPDTITRTSCYRRTSQHCVFSFVCWLLYNIKAQLAL